MGRSIQCPVGEGLVERRLRTAVGGGQLTVLQGELAASGIGPGHDLFGMRAVAAAGRRILNAIAEAQAAGESADTTPAREEGTARP